MGGALAPRGGEALRVACAPRQARRHLALRMALLLVCRSLAAMFVMLDQSRYIFNVQVPDARSLGHDSMPRRSDLIF